MPGVVATLGTAGGLLVSHTAAGPSLLGVAGSIAFAAAQAVVPRQLISLYGINIGPARAEDIQVTNGTISKSLGGVQVLFDGVPAALLYAGPSQINAIVPVATAGRESTTISIVNGSTIINGPTLPILSTLPQVVADSIGRAAAVNEDGTINSPVHPAPAGSVVAIFLTGGGGFSYTPDSIISTTLRGNPYSVSILGTNYTIPQSAPTSLEVTYAGDAPGQPSGVIQVNFRLPEWPVGQFDVQIGVARATFSLFR